MVGAEWLRDGKVPWIPGKSVHFPGEIGAEGW